MPNERRFKITMVYDPLGAPYQDGPCEVGFEKVYGEDIVLELKSICGLDGEEELKNIFFAEFRKATEAPIGEFEIMECGGHKYHSGLTLRVGSWNNES